MPTGYMQERVFLNDNNNIDIVSSNNTPSSPPSHLGNIIKSLTEVKYDDEVPAHIGDEDSFSPLVIDGVYKLLT